jgi:hypothetical protein
MAFPVPILDRAESQFLPPTQIARPLGKVERFVFMTLPDFVRNSA